MTRLLAVVRALVARLVAVLPDRLSVHLIRAQYRYDPAQIPGPIVAPTTPIRVLIAPANYAAQGFAWARAAERLDGVGALNMQLRGEGDYGFPSDYSVPVSVYRFAYQWSRRQRRAVASGFTHVIFEAEKPILGRVTDFDLRREAALLRAAGIKVAFASHGSDLRLPSRHAQVDAWTPFSDGSDPWVQALEKQASLNNALLDELEAPVFIPTPELLLDRPDATWLPIVVDPARWLAPEPPLSGSVPRVLHAPTHGPVKGTDLIEPITQRLHDEGVIDYVARTGVPSDDMPALYRSVDVVLEQFRLGIYATTAIEAMAAGRVVVGYLRDQVRDHVRSVSGLEIPVVQATADTLEDVLRDIVARPAHYRDVAALGPDFVRTLHDGAYSASVLGSFLSFDGTE